MRHIPHSGDTITISSPAQLEDDPHSAPRLPVQLLEWQAGSAGSGGTWVPVCAWAQRSSSKAVKYLTLSFLVTGTWLAVNTLCQRETMHSDDPTSAIIVLSHDTWWQLC